MGRNKFLVKDEMHLSGAKMYRHSRLREPIRQRLCNMRWTDRRTNGIDLPNTIQVLRSARIL